MRFPREQGWAHFRNTMSEPFSGRRTSSIPGLLFVDDDSAGGAGGGGGGGAGSGAGGEGGGDNSGGAGGGADEAAKKAEQDRKLAAEAANWRTKLRTTEKEYGDFKTTAQTQIDALKAEIEEIKSRGTGDSIPQGDQAGKGNKPNPEVDALNRKVKELSDTVRTERESRLKQENQLKTEKISGRVKDLVAEGKFLMPRILAKVLTEKVDIASDGTIVLKVPNEAGGIDEVPATLENLTKYRPVDDFDSFLPTSGASGAGSRGTNGGGSGDGIDWNKVRAGDMEYIAKNNAKIKAAMAAGQQ